MSQRIILFGPLPPPYGGVSIYMKALAEHLRSANVRVWRYGTTRPIDPQSRFIAHRRLATLWALLAEGRGTRILDASHFHFEYPNPLLVAIWILLKWVLRFEWYKNVLDGSLPKRYPKFGFFKRWLFHRAANAVDHFVVVSEDLRRWLRDEIRVQQPITVIPCLLPTPGSEQARPLSPKLEKFLQPYLTAAKRVCSIGVFYPSYGFGDVAQAVEQLRESLGKNVALLLLDGHFVCDEKYRDEVLWDRDWISVLQEVSNPEIYEILKRTDVFVRAFADESYGISRIEALWCGTPVIATRAGETRGMLLYDAGNVEQLTNQLQAVLLYPTLEDPNPWAEVYQKEAKANLRAVAQVLGIDK
ncbi:MAG TPA: glycosyltransferase family 4 protein [Pyrinomonadaceae bacterium]|nr:glycosyltransferase family 4 protein [Pyrinomonadaceae bacterium]